jgi:hypothetical protein
MDEIDATDGTSADQEIQRTLMELLNQLDGFDDLNSTAKPHEERHDFTMMVLQLSFFGIAYKWL